MSLAVDTGAEVNIICDNAFRTVQRVSPEPLQLLPNDLNVVGVTGANLGILGKVRLTVQLEKKVRAFSADFYVTTRLSLPVDGILGLETMKKLHVAINIDLNAVTYQGQHLMGMGKPRPLVPSGSQGSKGCRENATVSPVSVEQQLQLGEMSKWQNVIATVEGPQVIPDGVAKSITIKVKEAPVGSDICMDQASNINRLAVEATLSRVKEGHLSEALVVNTSGAAISLKHGARLSPCLAYGAQVVLEPEEFPSASVSSIVNACRDHSDVQSSMESFVKVAHYTDMRPALLKMLEAHRSAIALLGEPLGIEWRAEHHIKLRQGSNPVYINAYKLLQSTRGGTRPD